MNTALISARIHFHGTFWVVVIGDSCHTCLNRAQLLECLAGRPPKRPEPKPAPSRETVDEFLARGGVVTQIRRTKAIPLPASQPEETRPTPKRITLADLGF